MPISFADLMMGNPSMIQPVAEPPRDPYEQRIGGRMRGGEGGAGGSNFDKTRAFFEQARQAQAPANVDIPSRIRQAVGDIAGRPAMDAVRLNDLRAKLPDIPREQLDAALIELKNSGQANLMNLDNPRDIRSVGDAALQLGNRLYHTLWFNK